MERIRGLNAHRPICFIPSSICCSHSAHKSGGWHPGCWIFTGILITTKPIFKSAIFHRLRVFTMLLFSAGTCMRFTLQTVKILDLNRGFCFVLLAICAALLTIKCLKQQTHCQIMVVWDFSKVWRRNATWLTRRVTDATAEAMLGAIECLSHYCVPRITVGVLTLTRDIKCELTGFWTVWPQ